MRVRTPIGAEANVESYEEIMGVHLTKKQKDMFRTAYMYGFMDGKTLKLKGECETCRNKQTS